MKFFIRAFFKTLRVVMGPFMLIGEVINRPDGLIRPLAEQDEVDRQCKNLTLYQYKTCPFCIKVRQEMHRLSLKITRLDAQPEGKNRDDLKQGGGQAKVPCLRITDEAGQHQWLYDSGEIILYLDRRFAKN